MQAAVLEHLTKILASKAFVKSDRLSRFLRFAVEQALAGREDQLKEYVIGVEVFDRSATYDPRIDPIVRVEARRLRAKLCRYYETDGRGDRLRIEFPTGAYVPRFHHGGEPPPVEAPAPSPDPATIVVLPFANLSSDPENEYFSDGLTEELIHALTKVERLRVVAASSVMQFKGKPYDIRQIGERLKVCSVLEGSVRKAGSRVRITVQLIHAADGRYLWTETYDREMQDLFAIQEEIARAIVAALRVQLVGGPSRPLVRPSGQNLEAYNLYLKGRQQYNLRTEEGMHRSIDFYRRAIDVDPEFARAYAGIALSMEALGTYGVIPPNEVKEKCRASAWRALQLDPTLAEAHLPLAAVCAVYEYNWEEAESHYRRALELNPGYAEARCFYACDFLAQLGRLDEAFAQIHKALEMDPLSLVTSYHYVTLLISRRDYDQAIEQCRRMLDLDPDYYKTYMGLGRAYTQKGMYGAAIETFQRARVLSGGLPYVTAVLAHAYALAGLRTEAEQLRRELVRISRWRYVQSTSLALIALGLGELDRAFELLEKAVADRESPVLWLAAYPTYDALRSDPRYQVLLRRIGLPQAGAAAGASAGISASPSAAAVN
ncbi:MAG TPA: tetratricopeptide repeat protein [Bryobacteraceae bacterium]|nr:tetratricopeptide repeat protein [Bryobacteraceae bacterium]